MKNIKTRKYQVEYFIDESTIHSKNSWIVGNCMYCQHTLRSNQWKLHLQKCKKKPKPSKSSEQFFLSQTQKGVGSITNEDTCSQIIESINGVLKTLMPTFLRMNYPQGIDLENKSILFKRVFPACEKLIGRLSSPIEMETTLQDLQSMIPNNYHIKISKLLVKAEDIKDYPQLIKRFNDMEGEQKTKNKYRKALNHISKKLQLGWEIPVNKSNDDKQNKPQNEKLNIQNEQNDIQQENSWEETERQSSNYYEDSSMSHIALQNFQSSCEQEHVIVDPYCLKKKQRPIASSCNNGGYLFIQKTIDAKQNEIQFAYLIRGIIENEERVTNSQFNKLQNLKQTIQNKINIELMLKRCSKCRRFLDYKSQKLWQCTVCLGLFCTDCQQFMIDYCICAPDAIFPYKFTPYKRFLRDNHWLLSLNDQKLKKAKNRMTKNQISKLEKSINLILRNEFYFNFVRQAQFSRLSEQVQFCFNPLYDPYIQCANQDCFKIYQLYQKGLYLPKIQLKKKQNGYGIFSTEQIQKNSFLCQYAADVAPAQVARSKGNKIIKLMNGPTSNAQLQLVPALRCGIGPLINHSMSPNVESIRVLFEGVPRVILFLKTTVEGQQQLLMNYLSLA